MNVLSLFAGAGGFDLAADAVGWTLVGQSEIDPQANRVLDHHWPHAPKLGDVRDVSGPTLGRVDLVSAGFPCQDLSVAGRRDGLAGARSGLWWEIPRILAQADATWLVAENVAGLLSADDGRAMGAIVGSLAELGMVGAWRVLDAQHFGVAQRRRRVFVVARRAGTAGPHPLEVLDLARGSSGDLGPSGSTRSTPASRPGRGVANRRTVGALTAATGGPDDNAAQAGHLVGTLTATTHKSDENAAAVGHLVATGGPAPTLAADCAPTVDGARRLMPVECERLMGWPDHHTAPAGADVHRYRLCGNGVVTPVAQWIFNRIIKLTKGS